jgi:Arm DNA-binding domain
MELEIPMPAKRLTDAFVRNVRLPAKDDRPNQVEYIDTLQRGVALSLVVSYGGTKTFRAMRYVDGKAVSRKLGTYPALKLTDARKQALAYHENPAKFEAQTLPDTFKDIAERGIHAANFRHGIGGTDAASAWKALAFVIACAAFGTHRCFQPGARAPEKGVIGPSDRAIKEKRNAKTIIGS